MYDHLRIYLPIIIFPAHLRYQVYEHVKWWCTYYHCTREGFSRIWFSVFETQWSKTTLAMHTWFYYVLIFIRYTLYKEWYFRQSNRGKNLINLNNYSFVRLESILAKIIWIFKLWNRERYNYINCSLLLYYNIEKKINFFCIQPNRIQSIQKPLKGRENSMVLLISKWIMANFLHFVTSIAVIMCLSYFLAI